MYGGPWSRVLQVWTRCVKLRVRSKRECWQEPNVTRKRLHQIPSDFIGCNTLTSHVDLPGKGEKSHIVLKAATNRERCFDGVREVFEGDENQLNSPVREGKSD